MVATWDDLWFTEPGTRLLAVRPQSFADAMVPLQISPAPTRLERVFVDRVELITREQEQVLTSLLNNVGEPGSIPGQELGTAAAQLMDLQLGRYAAGGMERAATLVGERVRERFARLIDEAEQAREEGRSWRGQHDRDSVGAGASAGLTRNRPPGSFRA